MNYQYKYLKYKCKYQQLRQTAGSSIITQPQIEAQRQQGTQEQTTQDDQAIAETQHRQATKEGQSGTNKIECTDKCYDRIYNEKCDFKTKTCHQEVKYIWKILTNTDLNSTTYRDYTPDNFADLKNLILLTNSSSVYHIDLVCALWDNDIRRESFTALHTLIIEKVKNKYKIYQSYVGKYTIKEWLNGKLNQDVLQMFDLDGIDKSNKLYQILKSANEDNLELIKQFKYTVGNFGGPNCLPKEQIKKFLDLLTLMLNTIHNFTIRKIDTIKQINDISKQLFGPKLFSEDDKYNYVGRYKLIGRYKPTVFIRVKSSETTCIDRT